MTLVENRYRSLEIFDPRAQMPTSPKRSTPLAFLLLIAAAAGHAQTAEIDPDWPDWLKEAMQRETDTPAMTPLEVEDGAYRFQLPDTATPVETVPGNWAYTIDIGSGSPVVCLLNTTDAAMTAMAIAAMEQTIRSLLQKYGAERENRRTLYHLDAGSIDGTVFIALEWLSNFNVERGDLLMHTKMRAATKDEMVFLCLHTDAGYRDTFEYVFTTFVRSMQYTSQLDEPFAKDITVDTTNGQVTGATYTSLTLRDNGEFESHSYTTSILPVAPGEIQYSDSYYTEYSRSDGTIVDTYVHSIDNGETGMDLALKRDASGDSNDWTVSGEFQGNAVEFEIPATDALKGEMALLEETRDLFAGEEESLEALVWSPFLDPTSFLALTFTRDDDEVPRQGIARLGPVEMTTISDEHGGALSGHMTIGPNSIGFERVWSQGLPYPPERRE